MEFKARLDRHFGLARTDDGNPVNPEHRPSDDTKRRFAELCREDDWKRAFEDRLAAIERKIRV